MGSLLRLLLQRHRAQIVMLSALLSFCVLSVSPAAALERHASESDLKAAFIYNFIRFTEFPATAAPESIKICYAAREPLAGSLHELDGKRIGNRQVKVTSCFSPDDVAGADVVVIGQADQRYAQGLIGAVRGRPVLTVADFTGFTRLGGAISLSAYTDRMRFKVNLKAVRQQHLRIHPQLLKLASEIEE